MRRSAPERHPFSRIPKAAPSAPHPSTTLPHHRYARRVALLPPDFVDCVLALGLPSDTGTNWTGTGFVYFYATAPHEDIPGNVFGYAMLVTNKHVFRDNKEMVIRCNPLGDAPAIEYDLPLVNRVVVK